MQEESRNWLQPSGDEASGWKLAIEGRFVTVLQEVPDI